MPLLFLVKGLSLYHPKQIQFPFLNCPTLNLFGFLNFQDSFCSQRSYSLPCFFFRQTFLRSVFSDSHNLAKEAHNKYGFTSKEGKIELWIISFLGVFICSAEVGHLSLIYQSGSELSYSDAYKVALKSVYPVVWALSALVLMILGMKLRLKSLRVASLVLFSITIVKLFFDDLAGNSSGKIVSFILLGVILLLI